METMSFGLPETHYDLRPIRPLPKFSRDNCCWHGLFSEAVISQAPGLGRQTTSRGLELDFLRMLQLSAVEYPVFVESGLILMGYSAALVPIKETNDGMILWHLETSRHDSQFKVSDIKATKRKWLKVNSFDYLQSKRALIGWCSEANILLGTDLLAPRVTWSNAKVKATTWHWKGANLQVLAQSAAPLQMGGQIGFSFDRVLNTVQFNPSENYLRCLRNGVMEHVVLYDVGTERAWLVPLICVLHHMLLVYSEGIENEHRVNHAPKATISGPSASFMTLSDKGSLVLERSGDDSLTIRELIMGLSANLSKASLHKPARSEIYGYELMDVLMGSPRSELKKRRIKKEGLAWSSLLDGISCLFCSDLGDAIVGRRVPYFSSPCNSLPIGYNFMAASMQSIENLSMTHGVNVKSNFRQLSRAHFWQLSGSPFQRCRPDCQGDCWRCPDFLQAVRTARPSDKDQDNILSGHSKGALVFGAPLKGKMVEMTTLPTVFTKQPREIKILEMKSWYRRKYRLQSDIVSESSKKTRQGNNRTFVISD
ncbi:hypothetical protein N7499_010855 [Penicillium canescens]|nr:hypothetical protein N7499_010855 [Penicillium canescens]KAJ6182976.1 hypothetical protein N7485_001618 [Penicillium canescens]